MTKVEEKVKALVRQQGRITFAELMALALYDPEDGYYAAPGRQGPERDYFTSPSAHPAFGALLAVQLRQMWELLGRPPRFDVVELGAGSGLLCHDIVQYARDALPEFAEALHYVAVERQVQALHGLVAEARLGGRVQVVEGWKMPPGPFTGCILSNELVDAFPVHRVTVLGGRLQELYVTLQDDMLVEEVGEPSTPALAERLERVQVTLGEGWQAEVCLELGPWLQQVATALERGFVLTLDYGDVASELYSDRRRRGTLLCYYQHTSNEQYLERLGQQDITAHVDFTALVQEGREVGLEPVNLERQALFLKNLGLDILLRALEAKALPLAELQANRLGMQELARTDGLGRFLVLAQSKGIGEVVLDGFEPENGTRRWLAAQGKGLHLPLLTERHVRMVGGGATLFRSP